LDCDRRRQFTRAIEGAVVMCDSVWRVENVSWYVRDVRNARECNIERSYEWKVGIKGTSVM
jgi:hypothetical protein